MQAIVTKYLGPTNYRSGRVKAQCDAGTITLLWDHEQNVEPNHVRAARALCEKLGWAPKFHTGSLPRASKYAYVHVLG